MSKQTARRDRRLNRLVFLTGLMFQLWCAPLVLHAQTNQQAWFEYMLNYPFASSYNMENAVTYSTALSGPKWRALDYSLTVERSLTQHVDVMAQTVVAYTNQTETYNTLEIRPVIGTRLHFTPNNRIQTRLLLRLEQRNFEDLDTKTWTQTYRPRARAEALIPINRKSYFDDDLWYGILDAEYLFANADTDVKERFANKFRLRAGIGYRLNYTFRFEFIYLYQESRNGIDETFSSSDNIFRFRLKHFLRKTKPAKDAGVGN